MLSVPLMVTIIPSNDNNPEITIATIQVTFVEAAPRVFVFENLSLTDNDQTCSDNVLSYATVVVQTPNDMRNDQVR